MSKRIGVVFSGCGVYDGTEIHEAVITMLALDRAGAEMVIMAPNIAQMHVINHITGETMNENRNVLIESARIARGKIKEINDVKVEDIDALVFPGGYGAGKNLCNFAIKGTDCDVNPEVAKLIQECHSAGKPIVAICITPAVAVKSLTQIGVKPTFTIGNEKIPAETIEKMGAHHVEKDVHEVEVDHQNKLITSPAYMLDRSISQVASGIEKAIDELMKMLG